MHPSPLSGRSGVSAERDLLEGVLKAGRIIPRVHASAGLLDGGAEGIRTPDPHNAIVVLYQLSYDPNQSAVNVEAHRAFVKLFA